MDELKPGIYGQKEIPPIVMVRDGEDNDWKGPYYLLIFSKRGECRVWCERRGGKYYDFDSTSHTTFSWRYGRLATADESALIKEW